jgi:hypothetical protein
MVIGEWVCVKICNQVIVDCFKLVPYRLTRHNLNLRNWAHSVSVLLSSLLAVTAGGVSHSTSGLVESFILFSLFKLSNLSFWQMHTGSLVTADRINSCKTIRSLRKCFQHIIHPGKKRQHTENVTSAVWLSPVFTSIRKESATTRGSWQFIFFF